MTGVYQQATFWRFTASSIKSALRLYFAPIYRVVAWLQPERASAFSLGELRHEVESLAQNFQELERRVYAPPDSLSGLELRVLRLKQSDATERHPAFILGVERAQVQLDKAKHSRAKEREEILRGLRQEVQRLEQDLLFEGQQSWGAGAD